MTHHFVPLAIALAPVLLAAGCESSDRWEGTFDVPRGTAVLQPSTGGPFGEPVGYGASAHGGQIAIMALKSGRYLPDDPAASFLRASPLPTGHDRVISGLAAWAPDDETTAVWASDLAFGHLLYVPHVVGLDDGGYPQRLQPSHTQPTFIDADDSGDSARLQDLEVRLGWTSTEQWVLEYDGDDWVVRGSRSGPQAEDAAFGERYAAAQRAVEFTVRGSATAGDRIEFATDSGIAEFEVGGEPVHLAMAPDQSVLAMTVQADDGWHLRLFDPADRVVTGDVALGEGSEPSRLAWTPDGSTLYVADTGRDAAWELDFSGTEAAATEIPLPWPVFDVAPLGEHLYVAPVEGRSVWMVDRATRELVDFNPVQPGVNGLDFDTPVRGLEPIPMPYAWPQTDNEGVPLRRGSVGVSLYTGRVVFMGEGTGCLVQDELGPRTAVDERTGGGRDYSTSFGGVTGAAFLEQNATNGRHVLVNRCGGIARQETWTLTYRRPLQAWEVEGSRSGLQDRLAYEDERYVSDTGAVSFVLRGGVVPSEEGWTIQFRVEAGVVTAQGDNNGDGRREIEFDLPGDPAFFHYEVDEPESGWDVIDDRPFLLVPATGSDLYGRVEPGSGNVEAAWW